MSQNVAWKISMDCTVCKPHCDAGAGKATPVMGARYGAKLLPVKTVWVVALPGHPKKNAHHVGEGRHGRCL